MVGELWSEGTSEPVDDDIDDDFDPQDDEFEAGEDLAHWRAIRRFPIPGLEADG